VGKFVLLLAGIWVMILVAGIAVLAQGQTNVPALNWATVLLPGCALVPGAYLSLKLLRTQDSEQIRDLWVKSALYGASGLVIGIGALVALVQMQKGGS